jgi:hypothetical protein
MPEFAELEAEYQKAAADVERIIKEYSDILVVRSPTDQERADITQRFEAAHARLRDTLFRMGQYAFGPTSEAEQ